MSNKYAILSRTTRMQFTADDATEEKNKDAKVQNYTLPGGTLIKIVSESTQMTTEEPSSSTSSSTTSSAQVYIYDAVLREPNTTRLYECRLVCLMPVSEKLWPYIISIPEPQRRLALLQNKERCDWFCSAMAGDLVTIPSRCMEEVNADTPYDCMICYIGPVPEIHPVGYFFGLQLMSATPSPQAAEVPFTRKYFECDPENAIFTTADRIIQTPSPYPPAPTIEEIDENAEAGNDWSISSLFSNARNSIRTMFYT